MGYGMTAYDIENCNACEALDIARDLLRPEGTEIWFAGYMDDGRIWFVEYGEQTWMYNFGMFDPQDEWEVDENGCENGYRIQRTEVSSLDEVAAALNGENAGGRW